MKEINIICNKCHTELVIMNKTNYYDILCPACANRISNKNINSIVIDLNEKDNIEQILNYNS